MDTLLTDKRPVARKEYHCMASDWISEALYPHLAQNIPEALATFEKLDGGGRARLTNEGQNVVDAMAWL